MAYELKQEIRLGQHQQLVMTPQLQQAIKLLQQTRLELVETVREEIETNPVLECTTESEGSEESKEPDKPKEEMDWESYLEQSNDSRRAPINFSDNTEDNFFDNLCEQNDRVGEYITRQLKLSGLDQDELEVGTFIIGNIDNDGYLRVVEGNGMFADEHEACTIEEITKLTDANCEMVEEVLSVIQGFDPPGVGARTTRECLLIQSRNLPVRDTNVERIILNHLGELANKNYKLIATKLGITLEEVVSAAKTIVKELNPMPAAGFGGDEATVITPDVYITKVDGEYVVLQNDNGMPKLRISSYYRELLKGGADVPDATKEYIQERFRSALWLIKSVQQRQKTIYRVVESIIKFQKEFLDKGVRYLKPLTLKDIAEDIGVHESTVSRVTSNKYADTPRGVLRLKYFFSTSMSGSDGDDVSVEYIKDKMQELIDAEDQTKPLSDMKIVERLKGDGILLSRRTATKYREAIGVLSSHKRKSYI